MTAEQTDNIELLNVQVTSQSHGVIYYNVGQENSKQIFLCSIRSQKQSPSNSAPNMQQSAHLSATVHLICNNGENIGFGLFLTVLQILSSYPEQENPSQLRISAVH